MAQDQPRRLDPVLTPKQRRAVVAELMRVQVCASRHDARCSRRSFFRAARTSAASSISTLIAAFVAGSRNSAGILNAVSHARQIARLYVVTV